MTITQLRQRRDVDALMTIVNDYRDENRRAQAQAARALGEIGDPRAAGSLVRLLRHNDTRTKDVAPIGAALARMGNEAFEALVGTLLRPPAFDHKDAPARTIAVLESNWPGEAFGRLHAALDGPVVTRTYAAESLGWLRDPRAIEGLVLIVLNDPYREDGDYGGQIAPVRDAAAIAIRRMGAQKVATATLRSRGGDEAKWAMARIARARLSR